MPATLLKEFEQQEIILKYKTGKYNCSSLANFQELINIFKT